MYINNTCVGIRFYMDLHAFKFAVYRNNRGMRPTTLVLSDTLHLANPNCFFNYSASYRNSIPLIILSNLISIDDFSEHQTLGTTTQRVSYIIRNTYT